MIDIHYDRRFFDEFHHISYLLDYSDYFDNLKFYKLIILLCLIEHLIKKHY